MTSTHDGATSHNRNSSCCHGTSPSALLRRCCRIARFTRAAVKTAHGAALAHPSDQRLGRGDRRPAFQPHQAISHAHGRRAAHFYRCQTPSRSRERNCRLSPAGATRRSSRAQCRLCQQSFLRFAAEDSRFVSSTIPQRFGQPFRYDVRRSVSRAGRWKLDLGFVGLQEPIALRGFEFRTIASYKTVAALPEDNPLAGKTTVDLKPLASLFFIGMSEASYPGYREWLTKTCSARIYPPQGFAGCRS